MANPLDRTWYSTLVDDDGSGNVGTVWNKAQVDGLLDTVDASLAGVVADPVPGDLRFATNGGLVRTTADGADTGSLAIYGGGGGGGVDRGAAVTVYGNEHASQAGNVLVHLGRGTGTPSFSVGRGTDFATLLSVAQNGDVVLPFGHLQFPPSAQPSGNTNTLDDYREAPFTPFLWGATGGASGVGYVAQACQVIKVGGKVTVYGSIVLSAVGTIVGQIQIAVPFPCVGSGTASGTFSFWSGLAVSIGGLGMILSPGQALASLFYVPAGGATSMQPLLPANITASFSVYFSITYQAA